MLIVWGTKRVEKKLGWVSDYCPICDDARACRLIEVRMVSHVYYIPLGRGESAGHIRQCRHCKNKFTTDPTKYTRVTKDKRLSVEALTDATNPTLIEGMAELFDLREKAARGEVDDEDRQGLLYQPFTAIIHPVHQRKSGIHVDGRSGLLLLAMIVLPPLAFFVCDAVSGTGISIDIATGLAIALFVIFGLWLIISLATDVKRYIRKKFGPLIIKRLAPLNLTVEELQEVMQNLKANPDTAVIGKAFKADKLRQQIAIARENNESTV